MDIALRLVEHLLAAKSSIDRVDSIINQLAISRDQLLQTIDDDQYTDFFQLLRPSNQQGTEKVALTLDLFCCTHYANGCKNSSCPFLHLCPYNIRPMHTKCTNKSCQYDHDILKSSHNKRIINARDLSFIPSGMLQEVIRASADPSRSLWVCNEYGKKPGCSKRTHCDKLHYCYYSLTDSCTKSHCQHEINNACVAYFRQKEISEQDHEDILNAFRKVLRQRKTDYTDATPKNNQQKPAASASSKGAKATILEPTTPTLYENALSSKPEPPPPLPDHDQDILLVDHHDKLEYQQMQADLSRELGYPIKLLFSKEIISKTKVTTNAKPMYYYYPMENPNEIFQLLRWQNEDKKSNKSLTVYASLLDAHEAAKQNFDNNQFCILRVHLLHSGAIKGDLLPENRLRLNNSSTMCFDHILVVTSALYVLEKNQIFQFDISYS